MRIKVSTWPASWRPFAAVNRAAHSDGWQTVSLRFGAFGRRWGIYIVSPA